MSEQNWLKYGVIALAVVGGLVLIAVAMNSGDLENRSWVVEEMDVEGTLVAPIEGSTLSALFEDGGLGGSAGCNTYFGSYEASGNSISVGPLGSTLVFCSEPAGLMEQESGFLGLLSAATEFDVDGDKLTMSTNGKTLLVFSDS